MKNNKNTTSNVIHNSLPRLSDPALWDRIRDWHQTLSADKALTARIAASGVLRGEDASPLISEYLKFAYLAWISPDGATPSKSVDEAWHAHLLFTRSYELFCDATRGERLHHDPGDGDEGDEARFEAAYLATLDRYEDEFGPAPERWWPRPVQAAPATEPATARPAKSPLPILAVSILPLAGGIGAAAGYGMAAGAVVAMVATVAVMLVLAVSDEANASGAGRRSEGKGKTDSGSGGCSGGYVPTGGGGEGGACGDGGGGGGGDGGSCGSSCGGGGCGGGGCGGA